MGMVKKQRWTEDEIGNLPAGEHDAFDRKSGMLLDDPKLREKLSKALSAFANSGGGSLIIGVADDGTFDGVLPDRTAHTTTREWLEQVIPSLLQYPLSDFRVHQVEPAAPSAIPAGRALLVIDVGDSRLAPHQSTVTKLYYCRGQRSVSAGVALLP